MDKKLHETLGGAELKKLITEDKLCIEELDAATLQKLFDYETAMLCTDEGDIDTLNACAARLDAVNGPLITKEEFFLLIKSIACLFESAKENNIDPHEFVFDYECIFVGENITELEFIFAPDSETYKDGIVAYNKCSDMVSIIALYIECNSSEQSLKQEKDILQGSFSDALP